jgi:hypothetical protein
MSDEKLIYSLIYILGLIFVCVIFDLKLGLNYTELGHGVRLRAKKLPWGCSE